jgi:hypothetical protein
MAAQQVYKSWCRRTPKILPPFFIWAAILLKSAFRSLKRQRNPSISFWGHLRGAAGRRPQIAAPAQLRRQAGRTGPLPPELTVSVSITAPPGVNVVVSQQTTGVEGVRVLQVDHKA